MWCNITQVLFRELHQAIIIYYLHYLKVIELVFTNQPILVFALFSPYFSQALFCFCQVLLTEGTEHVERVLGSIKAEMLQYPNIAKEEGVLCVL